jgi:ribonuclease HII
MIFLINISYCYARIDIMSKPDIELEKSLWLQGYINVAGLDEAGRGPLAGPVTAGAVIINSVDQMVEGVKDSKQMTKIARERCFELIKERSTAWGVGIVGAEYIDEFGIQKAVLKAMMDALEQIKDNSGILPDYLIVDGLGVLTVDGYKMDKIKKGDDLHYSISAASVLAKVTRDRIMLDFAKVYPGYGFEKHVGYGTKIHIEAMKKLGLTPIHRKCYAPVKALL